MSDWRRPKQITPRRRRLTVPERILFDGRVHEELDEDAVRECCRKLKKQGVESVAISFLFSFVNPKHEKRAAEIVAREMPDVHISCSYQVLPRAPEYDRVSTTVVNAYVAPRVTSYLEKLVAGLKEAGYRNQLMVMQASGGVMTTEYIEGSPIRVLSSGPPAESWVLPMSAQPRVTRICLCVDMGGTSYDVSVVLNGAAPAEAGWNMHHRYLIGVPMVKVETLGGRRRLDLPCEQRCSGSGTCVRRRRAGSDLLWAWRNAADGDRCDVVARNPIRGFRVCGWQLLVA